MEMSEVCVTKLREHTGAPTQVAAQDSVCRDVPAKAAYEIAVMEESAILADLNDLVPFAGVRPLKPVLLTQLVAADLEQD
jgi:hypothetical protein